MLSSTANLETLESLFPFQLIRGTSTPHGSVHQANIAAFKMREAVAASTKAVRPHGIMKVNSARCEKHHKIALAIVTALAFLTRFCGLGHPSEVVFDEAHMIRVNTNHAILPFYDVLITKICLNSLPRGTLQEPTSSTYILHSGSYFMPSSDGSLDTMDTSSRTRLASLILRTGYPTWHFARCRLFLALLPFRWFI